MGLCQALQPPHLHIGKRSNIHFPARRAGEIQQVLLTVGKAPPNKGQPPPLVSPPPRALECRHKAPNTRSHKGKADYD